MRRPTKGISGVSVVECSNCGAQSEGEEFCPSCGAWLQTEGFEEFDLNSPAAVTQVPYNTIACPSCGAANPTTNRHCEECGARLMQGALPVAPQPILATTPGVRAAIAIGGLLIAVVLAALLFNWIRGDGTTTTTTTSTPSSSSTSVPLAAIELIPIASSECSSSLPNWPCGNMFDGDVTTVWNDESLSGVGASITVRFPATYQVQSIVITNVQDDLVRFKRNFRVASVKVISDDNPRGTVSLLPDTPGPHTITFSTIGTTEITIEIQTTHQAESVIDEETGESLDRFSELVVAELEFYGRRAAN